MSSGNTYRIATTEEKDRAATCKKLSKKCTFSSGNRAMRAERQTDRQTHAQTGRNAHHNAPSAPLLGEE